MSQTTPNVNIFGSFTHDVKISCRPVNDFLNKTFETSRIFIRVKSLFCILTGNIIYNLIFFKISQDLTVSCKKEILGIFLQFRNFIVVMESIYSLCSKFKHVFSHSTTPFEPYEFTIRNLTADFTKTFSYLYMSVLDNRLIPGSIRSMKSF